MILALISAERNRISPKTGWRGETLVKVAILNLHENRERVKDIVHGLDMEGYVAVRIPVRTPVQIHVQTPARLQEHPTAPQAAPTTYGATSGSGTGSGAISCA
jgi:hypothetical protein